MSQQRPLFTCSLAAESDGPDALAIRESDRGGFELVLVCSQDLSADVTETQSEVRIESIEGDVLRGDDCEGVLPLRLDEPVGGRTVVVDGATWVELADTCPWGFLGSDALGERLDTCEPIPD
ncbi:MAG: hypothetical protein AAGG08_13785 [Actinomycetota bacterium]